ncbi:pyrroloquinoline quinone biosynthesis protein PqqB [Streptosporangium carneum]|uniref:Coenzyme PQQ synthesis protein B n=1 Tax=Streptosporangium carneum TaxID=47481 RepID=A0A9W6I9H4_9ACTN|nr:MBL fold metallo-hydrolase [Streptosporangium carneum]GLK14550.1 coenzyme PQQ synthesis protein B [Streptosporangium carneum]
MRLRILGTAAGGGVPQWNCACPGCTGARTHPRWRRSHASLAVENHIVNATPDIAEHIESCEWLRPGPSPVPDPSPGPVPAAGPDAGRTRVMRVILTDAELDHTLGLPRLREADELEIIATPVVREALTRGLRLEEVLSPYAELRWRDLTRDGHVSLTCGVRVQAVPVSDKRPRYAAGDAPAPDWVVALRFTDPATGGTCLYAPAFGVWSARLEEAMAEADCVIVDGTFWDDEEPRRTGISSRTATEMGHLPIEATAERLARLPGRCLYTHLNNTNPLVDPDAPQHKRLAELGVEVAADGMVIEL